MKTQVDGEYNYHKGIGNNGQKGSVRKRCAHPPQGDRRTGRNTKGGGVCNGHQGIEGRGHGETPSRQREQSYNGDQEKTDRRQEKRKKPSRQEV